MRSVVAGTAAEAGAEGGDLSRLALGIKLEGVEKTYGTGEVAVRALRGVDLVVEPGQFVVILGPSGSGKTTLMNLVGGIERPSAGRIRIDGMDIAAMGERELTEYRRQQVGFVFQFFNLVPTLTAVENVSLVAELVGRDGGASLDALRSVGLAERADHFPAAMSGGEQQRVAIARALVKNPALMLCDEPTGSLDLDTGRQVLAALRRTSREAGRTVLFVTHNSAIAKMADRVLHLGSGRLLDDKRQSNPLPAEEVTW